MINPGDPTAYRWDRTGQRSYYHADCLAQAADLPLDRPVEQVLDDMADARGIDRAELAWKSLDRLDEKVRPTEFPRPAGEQARRTQDCWHCAEPLSAAPVIQGSALGLTPQDIDRADVRAAREYGHSASDVDPPAAYLYASRWPDEVAPFHPDCLVAEMIDRRELSPAARDMGVEEVLDQHADANAIDRDDVEAREFPAPRWAGNALAEQECGRCEQRILPPAVFTERQNLARALAAHDLATDRNDYDPDWTEWADRQFGPKADEHLVAHRAIEQYRARLDTQVRDWAVGQAVERTGVAGSEPWDGDTEYVRVTEHGQQQWVRADGLPDRAPGERATLNELAEREASARSRLPDSVESLRARLAAPAPRVGRTPGLT